MGCEKVITHFSTNVADKSFAGSFSARLQACHTAFVVRQLSVPQNLLSPMLGLNLLQLPHKLHTMMRQCQAAVHLHGVLSDLRHVKEASGSCDAGMTILQGMHGSTFAPLLVSSGPLQLQWRRWWKEQMQQLTQWCTALESLQRLST